MVIMIVVVVVVVEVGAEQVAGGAEVIRESIDEGNVGSQHRSDAVSVDNIRDVFTTDTETTTTLYTCYQT